MASRSNVRTIRLVSGSTGKAGYQKQRQAVRARQMTAARIPQAEWELAARAMQAPAYFSASGTEIKAIDIPQTTYPFRNPTTASNIVLLNGVQTGAAFYNRVGSRIEMKSIHIRGQVTNAITAVQGGVRMLLIYDRQPAGSLPVISDILQSRDQTGAAATTGCSEINLDNRDRFAIIRDTKLFTPSVTNTANVLTNGPQYPGSDTLFDIDHFVKLKNLVTHFKSSSNPTVIGDIATGALYAAFLTSSGGNDSCWLFNGGYRLRFGDK